MKILDDQIIEAINKTLTMRSAAKLLNIPFTSFKRKAIKLNLYVPNPSGKGTKKKNKNSIPIQDILIGKYPNVKIKKRKNELYELGYKKEICEMCGQLPFWNGKKLVLHLDHIDGNNKNDKLENLRILCPNCHTQTLTYTGRNIKLKNIQNNYSYYKFEYKAKHGSNQDYQNFRKEEYDLKQKDYIQLILNSNIDFQKIGWIIKVSKILNIHRQNVKRWMLNFMPDFYDNCFKR